MPSASPIYNPEDVLKKEERGVGDLDLGEVKDVSDDYVITEEGLIDKDRFYIPKSSYNTYWLEICMVWNNKKMQINTKGMSSGYDN